MWLGNNRGTMYSQKHKTLNVNQPEFWHYSFADMGQYDDIANIKTIKSKTGKDKIIYMGYSQGTTQMFYALAKYEESYLASSLEKFVALAPCTFFDVSTTPESYWENSVYKFPAKGVDELYGPNWTAKQKIICDNFDDVVCQQW